MGFSDRITWGLTELGQFTVKSCFSALTDDHCIQIRNSITALPSQSSFGWIWRLTLPPKIKQFLWLLLWDRLPTASYLYHIKVLDNLFRRLCQAGVFSTQCIIPGFLCI
ncbi:hypothetical protein P3S68_000943 [Capsicum galapagoense]